MEQAELPVNDEPELCQAIIDSTRPHRHLGQELPLHEGGEQ